MIEREIHKRNWQHPKSLKWHRIDYVIRRKDSRRKCLDVSVMRNADCNTDRDKYVDERGKEPCMGFAQSVEKRSQKKWDETN